MAFARTQLVKRKKSLDRNILVRRIESANIAARKAREKSSRVVDTAVQTAVGAGAAFAVSYASSKFNGAEGVKLGPVPLELAVGAGALILGATGMGGDASKYLLSAANGSFCAWAANMGRDAGLQSSVGPGGV